MTVIGSKMSSSAAPFVAAMALGAALLAGCSGHVEVGQKSVDKDSLASLAKDKLIGKNGEKPKDVTCEDGVPAKVDATQRCVLTAPDGTKIGVTATVKRVDSDDNVNIDFKVDDAPMG